jgi:hypothetical protein
MWEHLVAFIYGEGHWFEPHLNCLIGGGRRAPVPVDGPGKGLFSQQRWMDSE